MIKLFGYVLFEEAIIGISPLLSQYKADEQILFIEIYLASGQTIQVNLLKISAYLPSTSEKVLWAEKFDTYTQERNDFLLKHYSIGEEENV